MAFSMLKRLARTRILTHVSEDKIWQLRRGTGNLHRTDSTVPSISSAPPPSEAAKPGRGTSPPRISRSVSAASQQLTRSRRASQEFSPTRNTALSSNLATIPSAAAVQRALSAQRALLPLTGVDGMLEASRQDRPPPRSGPSSPAWPPPSPRIKSPPPPPAGTRNAPPRKADWEPTPGATTTSSLPTTAPSLKRLASAPVTSSASCSEPSSAAKQSENGPSVAHSTSSLRLPQRTSTNTTLETVAESSDHPSEPLPSSNSLSQSQELDPRGDPGLRSETSTIKEGDGSGDGAEAKRSLPDGDLKSGRKASTARTHAPLARRSLTSLSAKPKPPDPPRTMTVETEPVTSVPPLLVGDRGASARDGNGSIRTKGSSETIRPKKDKKKSTRKATSLHSGPPSSKADLFEAKVASAVEEADTSDSDETFVYESNPPDTRTHRHHSRTPSATSLAGQDQYGRNRHGIRSGSHAIGGKKSMKFSNSAYNSQNADDENADGQDSGRRTTHRHHHIGRHGKPAHASLFDPGSPFTQASKPNSPRNLTAGNGSRPSRPNSPRTSNGRLPSSARTKPDSFEVYDDVADDERTPLVGSVRVNRSRHNRRPHPSGMRVAEYYDDEEEDERPSWCSRWTGCMAVTVVLLVVSIAVTVFVLALNQPLLDVRVLHLQNILASEQELMLDLHVEAINANLFVISVSELDVNLFAESAYVGTSRQWKGNDHELRWAWRRSDMPPPSAGDLGLAWPPPDLSDGFDTEPDPIDEDPDIPAQKMLLGRILEFDSPLTFDPSPLSRRRSSSVGEIRLPQPGNKTEVGGSERWERVLQHPFDLIVRGVLRYQLPLSTKTRSVKIASRAKIYPGDSDDSHGNEGES
ncbi:hypothetical protein DV738_g3343, partial [Chaetothyriales sp. CBS 135597]